MLDKKVVNFARFYIFYRKYYEEELKKTEDVEHVSRFFLPGPDALTTSVVKYIIGVIISGWSYDKLKFYLNKFLNRNSAKKLNSWKDKKIFTEEKSLLRVYQLIKLGLQNDKKIDPKVDKLIVEEALTICITETDDFGSKIFKAKKSDKIRTQRMIIKQIKMGFANYKTLLNVNFSPAEKKELKSFAKKIIKSIDTEN